MCRVLPVSARHYQVSIAHAFVVLGIFSNLASRKTAIIVPFLSENIPPGARVSEGWSTIRFWRPVAAGSRQVAEAWLIIGFIPVKSRGVENREVVLEQPVRVLVYGLSLR